MSQAHLASPPTGLNEHDSEPVQPAGAIVRKPTLPKAERGGIIDRIEAFISKLSVRDNFWNSICSLIWLPLAFFS